MLVEEGWSERGALSHVSHRNPNQLGRKEALDLVLGVLSHRNLIDRVIESSCGSVPLSGEQPSLFRLAVHLLRSPREGQETREVLEGLRRVSPEYCRSELEKLTGYVLGNPDLAEFTRALEEKDKLALETGHPPWWVDYCLGTWGRRFAVRLLKAGQRPRYLHLNNLKDDGKLVNELASLAGLDRLDKFPGFFKMRDAGLGSSLREYQEKGIVETQDLASFLAVEALEPGSGDRVLDVCAAPGTKTAALAQLMNNKGEIVSIDYSMKRMHDWFQMTRRLGVGIASAIVSDASRLGLRNDLLFDLILVDPPCSGSGIFDRNPAMRWHFSSQRLARYAKLQYSILEQTSRFLRPSGRIVYSTCSITLEENENVISQFLSSHPEFETKPVLEGLRLGSPGLRGWNNCRRFYPHLDATAGYFIARLERIA